MSKALSKDIERLNTLFYDPKQPGSFSSAQKLYKSLKSQGHTIPLEVIQHWLASQETHTLHRSVKRKFPRNRVIVYGIDSQWDADLMDMTQLAKYNKSFKYVLLCIDILSKFVWVVPLKSKKSKDIVIAFKKIFAQGRKPHMLRTDKGREFLNKMVSQLFKKEGIHHFVTQNELKANVAERAIKTIKGRIFKYFTKAQSNKYINVLQDIVHSYNRTFHRSIQMTPIEVNKDNEAEVWQMLYLPFKKDKSKKIPGIKAKAKFKFEIGDTVRITHLQKAFSREYDTRWSEEIFKIKMRQLREALPVYKLKDLGDDDIEGTFYEPELQKILLTSDTMYKIEKIIDTKKERKKTLHYVKWLFWPAKFNSWIKSSDMKKYKR